MTNVFGYVTSRPFGKFIMPVPAQNSCIREYVNKIGGTYILPPLEHKFEACYMQLYSILPKIKSGDILAMYSMEMVLESNKAIEGLNKVFSSGGEVYFVLEAKKISTAEHFKTIVREAKLTKLTLSKTALLERMALSVEHEATLTL